MADARLVLFVDGQNTYKGARETFCKPSDPHTHGQFDPLKLGELITARQPGRKLHQVRVYTGRHDPRKNGRAAAANQRQCAAWEKLDSRVKAIWRPVKYEYGPHGPRPVEKGIDVQIALDFVTFAIDDKYDVGVLLSTDTDLLPALEDVRKRFNGSKVAEVSAWTGHNSRGQKANARLYLPGMWCHFLKQRDFAIVSDYIDYAPRRDY